MVPSPDPLVSKPSERSAPNGETDVADNSSGDPRRVMPPPRYSLATLAWVITLIAVMFAISQWIGPLASMGLVILGSVMLAHLAASYVGHQLLVTRKHRTADDPPPSSSATTACAETAKSRLAHHHPPHRWTMRLVVVIAILGTAIGALCSTLVPADEFNWAVVAVCAFSGGILAAIGGFVLSNFLIQVWVSWFEAEQYGPRRRR
ncbi:MAG: hypothetical protein WD045_05410 [Pirellulaceae bacterium]